QEACRGDDPQEQLRGEKMQRPFILAATLCLALTLECRAQSSENKPQGNRFGEINVSPIRDLMGKMSELCNSGQPSSFSVVESFEVDPDGSIPRSSIRTITSSVTNEVDTDPKPVLWMMVHGQIR